VGEGMNFHDMAFSLKRFLKCSFNYFILKANRFMHSALTKGPTHVSRNLCATVVADEVRLRSDWQWILYFLEEILFLICDRVSITLLT